MHWNRSSKKYRESKVIKNILKILLIGFAAAIIRIIDQISNPIGEQTIPASSIFAQNGPHAASLDCITYPIADSAALIIKGLMLG